MITAPINGPGRMTQGSQESAPLAAEPKTPETPSAAIGMQPVLANGPADRIDVSREAAAKSAQMQTAQAAENKGEKQPPPDVRFSDQVRELVKEFQQRATSVQFAIDEENGQVLMRIVNKTSGETIRQIPPDEVLKMQQKLKDLRGILFHQVT